MAVDRLIGVRLKMERAKEHIRELDGMISRFAESHPYTISSKEHPVPQIRHTTVFVSQVSSIPREVSVVIGDVVHNLRSALDHLAWQLVEAGGGVPDVNTAFPISKGAKEYQSSVKRGATKGMSPAVQKLIAQSQRHVSGDDTLWHIHELDRLDKHRLLIAVAVALGSFGVNIFAIRQTLWLHEGDLRPLVNGQEIVNIPTDTWEREARDNFILGIDLAFGEPQIAYGKSVLATLNHMVDCITTLAKKFEPFLV